MTGKQLLKSPFNGRSDCPPGPGRPQLKWVWNDSHSLTGVIGQAGPRNLLPPQVRPTEPSLDPLS